MAKRTGYAIGVEIIPEAVVDARENARANGIRNAEFICSDASRAVKELRERDFRPDVVLVDPPRKGLDEEVVGSIGAFAPSRVVYVSCDPGTLARDLKRLSEYSYIPRRLTVVDMFPWTRHTECVCLAEKK
jgi:23S rRNA (uracil1939-C5)-methyltransferase